MQPWFEKKWKPSLHESQFTPETPFLHGHNPDLGSHKSDIEPMWLQSHSTHSAVILPKPSCKQFGLYNINFLLMKNQSIAYHTTITCSTGEIFFTLTLASVYITRICDNGSDTITIACCKQNKKWFKLYILIYSHNKYNYIDNISTYSYF